MLKELFGELPFSITDPLGIVAALAERRTKRRSDRQLRLKAIAAFRRAMAAFGAEEQLDLFIGNAPVSITATAATQAFCREVATQWSDQQITTLCDGVIRASLEALKTYTAKERRKELLTWFAPASDPNETLSFAFCCRVAGLNPEPITALVWREYKAEIQGFLASDLDAGDPRQTDLLLA